MLRQNLLLKCFYYLFFMIHFFQFSSGHQTPYDCKPSACGHIGNISYPFRLREDPQHYGNSRYQLSCENNTTSVYIISQKYLFQAINYENYTIHLTDPTVEKHNSCSVPKQSLHPGSFGFNDPYRVDTKMTRTITFMSYPYPVSNASQLVETTQDCFNQSGNYTRHTYIKLGMIRPNEVDNMWTVDRIAMSSLPVKDEKNVSLSEIHSCLLYGFELSFRDGQCIYDSDFYFNCLHKVNVKSTYVCSAILCSKDPWWLILLGWIVGCLAIVAAYAIAVRILIGMPCMLGILIYRHHRRKYSSMFEVIEGFLQSNNDIIPIRYSYSDIKKMTRGFQEKLGEGGYGSVYKGKLRSGHEVAVKVLNKPKASGQDFINEVSTIGRIHHVNVVKLVGYCAERSKRVLIYDYMTNGSLDKYIFKRESANSLSLERKYEIAVGVARGIEYLHQGCDIQILHFDIKPHNILLDSNFTPKISDFGLAKFFSTKNNSVTLTAARGTIGYVAPELINRSIGKVSYKVDVYSFGMLLMEMVGLKKDVVAGGDDESSKYFPYWIYDRLNEGNDIQIEDADEDNTDDDEYAKNITRKMTVVGLWCIQISPGHRPSMGEVLKMLEGDSESLQIPTLQPSSSQTPQTIQNNDETWGTESTDSITLLDDDASSLLPVNG